MSARVSIIIPCYKDAATLGRALESVYAQTRQADEVVVVNDCSPQTAEIETVLQDFPHVVYVKNSRNRGLAATRNVGVRTATGDILSFLDADDELHPQKLEFQLSAFAPDVAVACRVRRIGIGASRGDSRLYKKTFGVNEFTSSLAIIWRNRLTGASIMISKELLSRHGGYDEGLRSCEDYDLWLRLLDAGVVVRDIKLPLYLYRYNENGLSRNYLDISYWELQVLRKYFDRQGRTFLSSRSDAAIWAFWVIKHMVRFELCMNRDLRFATRLSIGQLSGYPLLAWLLNCVDKGRLFWPIGMLAALRRQWLAIEWRNAA